MGKRKKLIWQPKLDKTGCAVCSVAIVANKPYIEIRALMAKYIDRFNPCKCGPDLPKSVGLHPEEMRLLLSLLNIKSSFMKFVDLKSLKNNVILCLAHMDDSQLTHAVVYDASNKTILDPDRTLTHLDNYNVYSCIEVKN